MKKERRISQEKERQKMKRATAKGFPRRAPGKTRKIEGKAKEGKILKRKRTSSRTGWKNGSTRSKPRYLEAKLRLELVKSLTKRITLLRL